MNKQRLIVTAGAFGFLWLPACADPCADDGLLQEPSPGCPMFSGADSDSGSGDVTADSGSGSGSGAGDCNNGIQDGDETDVDCGGSCENKCGDGEGCGMPDDCESGLCGEDGTCAPPSCEDGFENGDETDVDCGGSCDGCEEGEDCQQDTDCASGVCEDDGTCGGGNCNDGMQNGDETDVDCGGSCDACPTGDGCMSDEDCESGICDEMAGICAPAACDDEIENGTETDLDCGAACGPTCIPGEECDDFYDCVHLVCDTDNGLCLDPTCTDDTPNGNETDVDCGGPDCPPCDAPGNCIMDSDCESMNCDEGQCVPDECTNSEQDGAETDIDCGGPDCAGCDDGEDCLENSDCLSNNCDPGSNTCTSGSCDDGIQNGDETDIDCGGGTCDGCDNGEGCLEDSDCMSDICDPALDVCEDPSCLDGLLNGDETDIDCGGPSCGPCNTGEMCNEDGDCQSEFCDGGTCVDPTCSDGVKNGLESDVDCGGPDCDPCNDGEDCLTNLDCVSMVCLSDECQPASCSDEVLNGNETDVDCGGPDCQPCNDGEDCLMGSDCESGVCDPGDNTCSPPTCMDMVENGNETDVDCGGGMCSPCQDGEGCLMDSDCESMVCNTELNVCEPPNCADGVQNGNETDTDCGGMCGATCEPGEDCLIGGDCISAGCDVGSLTCNDLLTVSVDPVCAEFGGMPVPLLATASGGTGGPYTYSWTPDDGTLSNTNMAATDASPMGYQTYTVEVDDGANTAQDDTLIINSNPFDLENNCVLFTADYGAGAGVATITYDMGGTRACELGNNEFGLHLCNLVTFEETRLQGTLEVTNDGGDNDWIGLVWGAQDESNMYSLVWKQSDQGFFGCTTPTGVLIKRIEGPDFASLTGADFYCPNDTTNSTLLLDPMQSYDQGWAEGESYTVTIDFLPAQSDITITRDSDGVDLASFTMFDTTFPTGFFGSTTLSQENACVGPLQASCL